MGLIHHYNVYILQDEGNNFTVRQNYELSKEVDYEDLQNPKGLAYDYDTNTIFVGEEKHDDHSIFTLNYDINTGTITKLKPLLDSYYSEYY